jgi:hypothetical protein
VSLAGGRKTMSFLAGHALSLLGRPQDRLSHVLVDTPFEQIPEALGWFFYPTKRNQEKRVPVWDEDGRETGTQLVDFAKAKVRLAPVPYLRLRDALPPVLLAQATSLSFSELVTRAQRSLEAPVVELDSYLLKMTCAGIRVPLPEKEFACYLFLAKRADQGITPRALEDAAIEQYLDCYEHVLPGGHSLRERGRTHDKAGQKRGQYFDLNRGEWVGAAKEHPKRGKLLEKRAHDFSEMATRINGTLQKALGPYLAPRYAVLSGEAPEGTQYRLPADLTMRFVDERPRKEI